MATSVNDEVTSMVDYAPDFVPKLTVVDPDLLKPFGDAGPHLEPFREEYEKLQQTLRKSLVCSLLHGRTSFDWIVN